MVVQCSHEIAAGTILDEPSSPSTLVTSFTRIVSVVSFPSHSVHATSPPTPLSHRNNAALAAGVGVSFSLLAIVIAVVIAAVYLRGRRKPQIIETTDIRSQSRLGKRPDAEVVKASHGENEASNPVKEQRCIDATRDEEKHALETADLSQRVTLF